MKPCTNPHLLTTLFLDVEELEVAQAVSGTSLYQQLFLIRIKALYEYTCHYCGVLAFLGIVPWEGLPETMQPRFITNNSERFESHWGMVRITESPAIMLQGMEDSILGIWTAHGGGKLYCPDPEILTSAREQNLTPVAYVDDDGIPTEKYRFNPNGSPAGIASFCSKDGRHLAIMPHPERAFLLWQWPYIPEEWKTGDWKKDVGDYVLTASPWLKMFQNAYKWCKEN